MKAFSEILRKRSKSETPAERAIIKRINWRILGILGLYYGLIFVNRHGLKSIKFTSYETAADSETPSDHQLAIKYGAFDRRLSKEGHARRLEQLQTHTVFFQGAYGPPQLVTNVILLHFDPRYWLAIVMSLTGLFATISGAVNGYNGLKAVRFLLGLSEAAFFPAAIYLLSRWYRRDYLGVPTLVYYASAALFGAVFDLMGAGIARINKGMGASRAGYQWVSIIEGIVTILAVGAVLFLPNPPEITETLSTPEMEELQRQGTSTSDSSYTYDLQSRRASMPMPPPPPGLPPMRPDSLSIHSEVVKTREKFFNPEERATFDNWITRDDECRGIPESLRKHWWTPSLTDPKTYLFLVVNVTGLIARDLIVEVLPPAATMMMKKFQEDDNTDSSDLVNQTPQDPSNYATIAILLTVPPLLIAFLTNWLIGWFSDVTRKRGFVNMACAVPIILSGIILRVAVGQRSADTSSKNQPAEMYYCAAFLLSIGSFASLGHTLVWICNNTEGYSKRAIVLGLVIGISNTVQVPIAATTHGAGLDGEKELHFEKKRYELLIATGVVNLIASFATHEYLRRANKRKAYQLDHDYMKRDPNSDELDNELDLSPQFRYFD